MTQDSFPVTPPPELVQKWALMFESRTDTEVFTEVGQWFADQELEACLQWFSAFYFMETWMQKDLEKFRNARRPKPPSLKNEVRQIIDCLIEGDCLNDDDAVTLRRALESLPD